MLAGTSHVLADPAIELLLESTYYDAQLRADAAKQEWDPRDPYSPAFLGDFGYSLRPAQGEFVYIVTRAMGARLAVCVPASAGASLLYLGAAMRDNGGGRVIGLEPREEYRARACQAVTSAQLDELVELRCDETEIELESLGGQVDVALIDGWPDLSAPSRARAILGVLTPALRRGALVINDNCEPDYLDLAAQRYTTLQTDLGLLSVRR
jgi:predicted O-methyltransferase YrrM